MTFRELFQTGQCSINAIDEWVALWHKSGGLKMSLQTFLGLNADEYQVWLTHGNAGLADLLKEGRSPEYTLIYLGWDELAAQLQEIVDKELGAGFTVSLRRQDYYYWDFRLQTGQEMTEELSERICERLDLCDVDVNIFMDDTRVDGNHLHRLLSRLTHREVTSSHADDNGVYIICKSLIWSSPEFMDRLLANHEARLRREINSSHYPMIDPNAACHRLLGFMDALNTLGLLDEENCRVAPDHFISPTDTEAALEDREGICPVCGGEIEYGVFKLMDDGGTYDWGCPACGASGREGYDLVFDGHHYDVQDGNGNKIPGRDDQEAPAI